MNVERRVSASEFLRRHGIRPRHRLGQNFLEDPSALAEIAAAAGIGPDDTVLEIGCGFGSLTALLAAVPSKVVAVEVDARLLELAKEYLAGLANVDLVCGDILKLAPAELGLSPAYIAAANIPYYVTSPIIRHLLESKPKPRRLVLTIQEEVARRACAAPPHMSMLALSVQVYGSPEVVSTIPPQAFYPVPKVSSAILRIEAYDTPVVPPARLPMLFRVAKACFTHRRKMLRNSLGQGLSISVGAASKMLELAGIEPTRRPQTLGLAEWDSLTQAVEAERS
jgi:16S rRNA (adenine1518-N6/adenine1519-N6)-dimethyltransferase